MYGGAGPFSGSPNGGDPRRERPKHAESRWHRQAPEGRVQGLHESRGHGRCRESRRGCTRAGDADKRRGWRDETLRRGPSRRRPAGVELGPPCAALQATRTALVEEDDWNQQPGSAVVTSVKAKLAFLLLASLVTASEPASATDCGLLSDWLNHRIYSHVFVGRLVSLHDRLPYGTCASDEDDRHAYATFEVIKPIMGRLHQRMHFAVFKHGNEMPWFADSHDEQFIVTAMRMDTCASMSIVGECSLWERRRLDDPSIIQALEGLPPPELLPGSMPFPHEHPVDKEDPEPNSELPSPAIVTVVVVIGLLVFAVARLRWRS